MMIMKLLEMSGKDWNRVDIKHGKVDDKQCTWPVMKLSLTLLLCCGNVFCQNNKYACDVMSLEL